MDETPVRPRAGGAALYSALTARNLGLRAAIVTAGELGPDHDCLLQKVQILTVQRDSPTRFLNRYGPHLRQQRLLGLARPIDGGDIPALWHKAPLVHLGPVALEVSPALASHFQRSLVGASAQGWLRRWDRGDAVEPVPWWMPPSQGARLDLLFASQEDLAATHRAPAHLRGNARALVLTLGIEGGLVYLPDTVFRYPAFPCKTVDPTGAGDVFAAAFMIRYAETQDPRHSAMWASCAASWVVEGWGVESIPTRAMIEDRMRSWAPS